MKRIGLVILVGVCVCALLPQKVTCGVPGAACAYPANLEEYVVSYEIQPRAITWWESITHKNTGIHYSSGEERTLIDA